MWKKILTAFKNSDIRRQLYTIYFLVIFLPVVIIGTFLIVNTSRLLMNYHGDLLESDNRRTKTILFEITTQVSNISEDLAYNRGVRDMLSGSHDREGQRLLQAGEATAIDNYENTHAEIASIEIYTDNPGFTDYKQFRRAGEELQASFWYQRALKKQDAFWAALESRDQYGNEYWNLSLVRRVPLSDSEYHAVMVIRLSDNYLHTRIDSRQYGTMACVDNMPIFYSSDRKKLGNSMADKLERSDGGQHIVEGSAGEEACLETVSSLKLYQTDSVLYISTRNSQAFANIKSILSACLAIVAAAALIPWAIIRFFTEYLSSRILGLRQAMHQASNENYEFHAHVGGQDEIGEAFEDLEVMVQKIQEKDAAMYEAQIRESNLEKEQQKMEFKMLASQINPHFLYNTLETIRMKAFTAGDREVARAIRLLGKSLRYVLDNTGTAFTTLEQELEHVRVYLDIQKLRFPDKFESCIRIEEGIDAKRLVILPLLLQPVVENAILHGLEEKESGGLVEIRVLRRMEEQELICIEVWDNGCGMDGETLAGVRRRMEEGGVSRGRSIGLYNINMRLKLNYGSWYALQIESREGEGTIVRIRIPLARMQETETARRQAEGPARAGDETVGRS